METYLFAFETCLFLAYKAFSYFYCIRIGSKNTIWLLERITFQTFYTSTSTSIIHIYNPTLMKKHLFFSITLCVLLLTQTVLAQTYNYFAGLNAGRSNTTGSYNSFVGHTAGHKNTTGSSNIFIGYQTGYSNTTGNSNSFLGTKAGYGNSSGSNNSFVGHQAGYFNTTGFQNSFVGNEAGYSNTTGSRNSFLGAQAGSENTTGNNNTFLGHEAGYYNTTGSNNSFMGKGSGTFNTTGSENSFFGFNAGYRNTTGFQNSFVGYQAGINNTSGNRNSFIGYNTGGFNTTGSQNSFIGFGAGYRNTTGSENSFLGYAAGYLNTTGNFNSFLGYNAGYNNTTGERNSFIGYQAGYLNTIGVRNSFIGYGAGYNNTSGVSNTFLGFQAGYNNRTGSDNVNVGRSAGYYNTGNGNVFIGYLTSNPPSAATITNAGAIGSRASVTISNAISLGSISGINGAVASTNVGIGTTAPAYRLQVNGTAAKPGGSVWIIASDKRLKQNVNPFTDGLEMLQHIKPVRYRYNGKAAMPIEQEYIGVIAQEVQQVAPYMVGEFIYQDSTGKQETYLDYDATALTYILVNAAKELKQENELLKQENAEIKQDLASIKALLVKLMPEAGNSQARLWQNTPNPSTESTIIKFQLPLAASSAYIKVFSSSGQEVKSYDLTGKSQGEVTLSGSMLSSGTYVYTLFVDGVRVDSKKLVITQ